MGMNESKSLLMFRPGAPAWHVDEELLTANVIIAQREMALAALLRLDSRFELAYEDDAAVVFLNRSIQIEALR